jgi:hypothetical protein
MVFSPSMGVRVAAGRFARSLILTSAVLLTGVGCHTPVKNFTQGEWTEFVRVNPNDIAVSPVTGLQLPKEVRLDQLREDLRTELLNHKYAPVAFSYVDAGAGSGTSKAAADVRVDLIVKRFEVQRYEMSRSMRIVGEFLFREAREGAAERSLATVNSDQTIDLGDEHRRGASLDEAVRVAGRRFIEISLAGMPDRNVDAK